MSEEPTCRVGLGDAEDVRRAVAAAKAAFPQLSRTSVDERIGMLQAIAESVSRRKDELVQVTIEEYGAPAVYAHNFVRLALEIVNGMRELLNEFQFVRFLGAAKVVLEPRGVTGAITPWNAGPISILGKLAPSLAAGCPIVLKPSELSARQNQMVAECIHEAGLPTGVVNIVTGTGDVVGEALTTHPDVAKIAFTGSTAVGKRIYRNAAETMKRLTLELGGKSPTLLLDDADVAKAIPLALTSCFHNSGQACHAGSRLLVPEPLLDAVMGEILSAMDRFPAGDPHQKSVRIGPMVSKAHFERVQRYIELGLKEGAALLAGGPGRPERLAKGYFVRPTVFTGVTPDMAIAREEIFGPVLSVMSYGSEEEGVALANNTPYGLSAYVHSQDLERANRVAGLIQSGVVMINGLYGDLRAPFGGVKQSGLGREFGVYGLEAHLEPKTLFGWGDS